MYIIIPVLCCAVLCCGFIDSNERQRAFGSPGHTMEKPIIIKDEI
jgi:hypothetical protein